ncbi:MAG TPA: hypothetical protein VFE99_02290 [Agromyces sp.]|nr:hypothetical protein [Agromyces sp.]
MTASAETPGATPEHPSETDAAVTAVIAGWNDEARNEARDERDPRGTGADPALTPPPAALTVSSNGTTAAASAHPRPTVRWGALVWSLLFGALAGTALWLMLDPDRLDATGEWLATLSPLAAALYALVALGVILALFGIVGLIRRGEHSRR